MEYMNVDCFGNYQVNSGCIGNNLWNMSMKISTKRNQVLHGKFRFMIEFFKMDTKTKNFKFVGKAVSSEFEMLSKPQVYLDRMSKK